MLDLCILGAALDVPFHRICKGLNSTELAALNEKMINRPMVGAYHYEGGRTHDDTMRCLAAYILCLLHGAASSHPFLQNSKFPD